MDFKDWRTSPDETNTEQKPPKVNKFHGKQYRDYIEEQIREAQERGAFDNLQGSGKPSLKPETILSKMKLSTESEKNRLFLR